MDRHVVIGLGKKMGESHAHCSCGWSISGSAGGVGGAVSRHLARQPGLTARTLDPESKWARRAALPFTGRTS